jgi:hypothetical protein
VAITATVTYNMTMNNMTTSIDMSGNMKYLSRDFEGFVQQYKLMTKSQKEKVETDGRPIQWNGKLTHVLSKDNQYTIEVKDDKSSFIAHIAADVSEIDNAQLKVGQKVIVIGIIDGSEASIGDSHTTGNMEWLVHEAHVSIVE